MKNIFGFGRKRAATQDLPPSDAATFNTAVGSFSITGPQGDRTVMQQLIQTGRYEDHLLLLLRRLCRKDFTVLDVGANVGVHSLPLSRMARNGTIHAFEACPDILAFLKENVRINRATNIVPWNGAVSNVDGDTTEISYSPGFAGGAFVSTNGYTENSVHRIPTITLDAWAERVRPFRIDLIKMDIEGAEWMALEGGRNLITKFRPRLIVECNASTLCRWHGKTPADLFRLLREHYGFISALVEQEDAAVCRIESEHDLNALLETGKGLEDLLCSPDEPDVPKIPLTTFLSRLQTLFGRVNLLPHSDMVLIQDVLYHDPKFEVTILEAVEDALPSQRFRVKVSIANTGLQLWSSQPPKPVNVSYFWRTVDGHVGVRDGLRTMFPSTLAPGSEVTLEIEVEAPAEPGPVDCCVSLVQEGLCWFDQFHPESAGTFRVEVLSPAT